MSNYLNSKTGTIVDCLDHYDEDEQSFMYTDDASFKHKRKCCLYININMIEQLHYFETIGALNHDMLRLIREAMHLGDKEEGCYNEILILFKV